MYKIFVSATAYDSGKSGISVYINHILNELSKEHRLEVLAFNEDIPLMPQSENIKYQSVNRYLRNPVINMLWHLFILPWFVRWRKYDFILLPAGNRRLFSFCRKFTIAVVHDLSQYHVDQKYDCFRMFYCKKILPFYLKSVNRIASVSQSTANDLQRFWKIPESRITVVYNGFDKEFFNTHTVNSKIISEKYGINKKYILYVSRIEHPGKNHLNLIKAYEALPENLQDEYDLVLAGSLWAGAEPVKEYAEKSKVSENIKFTGFINHSELPAFYHGCSLYIFPSYFEGFGLSLVEAMACGIPTACSNSSSLGEIGKNAALLFDPHEINEISSTMENVLKNPDLRSELVNKGFEKIKTFDWKKHASELVNIYENSNKIICRNPFFDFPLHIFEILAALLICTTIAMPVLFIAIMRKLFTGKNIFTPKQIYGKCERKLNINIFNFENIFLSRVLLFFYIITLDLRFVGVSRHDFNPAERHKGDADLFIDTPGIFSLWFVRKSRGTAYEGRLNVELEYLKTRSLFGDLMIILRTFPAIMFSNEKLPFPRKIHLLDIEFDNINMGEAIQNFADDIDSDKKRKVFFVNSDCFNKGVNNKKYLDLLKGSDYILPDGIGVLLACKMLKVGLKENVNGTDMLPFLCETATRNNYSIFLFGAKPGVAALMSQNLLKVYPSLQIVGKRDGYFTDTTEKEMIKEINSLKPNILLVALGVPHQEQWITKHFDELECNLMFGVGGLFDFYSGRIKRAPRWMRETGFEWLFRLKMEPVRMFKRYIIGNPLFLWRVFRWKRKNKET
jgi:exopolysaccharide biosynthesis WecB/TagA/CpsF family protein